MTTALAKAPDAGLVLNIEKALALVRESTDLRELKDIRDQATLLEGLARTRDASQDTQNAAAEVKLRAERRIDEVMQAKLVSGERQGRGDAGRAAANGPKAEGEPLARPATLEDLGIKKSLAQRVRQVGKVPEAKFEAYVETMKQKGEEITTAGLLNFASRLNPHAASNVNNAAPDKNDKFTERAWVQALKDEFNLDWDFAGHELAPATEVFGRKRVWTVDDDCFTKDWTGKRGLLNPPWDELPRFVVFAWLKVATGECPLVVLPLPGTRWEQDWAQEFVHPFRPDEGGLGAVVRFPRGRKGYGTVLDPEGERPDNNVGLPSAELILRGPFVRSPRLAPVGTIDEVLAAQRFGEDKGLAHLWRQALAIARGRWSGAPGSARRLAASAVDPAETETERQADESAFAKEDAKARAPMLSVERFLDEVAKLPNLSGQLGKTKGQPCITARCDAWPDKLKGWRCTKTFRLPLNGQALIARSELAQLQEHARSHVGKNGGRR